MDNKIKYPKIVTAKELLDLAMFCNPDKTREEIVRVLFEEYMVKELLSDEKA